MIAVIGDLSACYIKKGKICLVWLQCYVIRNQVVVRIAIPASMNAQSSANSQSILLTQTVASQVIIDDVQGNNKENGI